MKRPLLVAALATLVAVLSWGVWALLETGQTSEFHPRVLIVFLVVGAALVGAMVGAGEPSLEHVAPKLQVAALLAMAGGIVFFGGWRHPNGQAVGDLLMLSVIAGLCWRVPFGVVQSARRPVRRRLRRMRGPHLRVVS